MSPRCLPGGCGMADPLQVNVDVNDLVESLRGQLSEANWQLALCNARLSQVEKEKRQLQEIIEGQRGQDAPKIERVTEHLANGGPVVSGHSSN